MIFSVYTLSFKMKTFLAYLQIALNVNFSPFASDFTLRMSRTSHENGPITISN